METEKSPMNHNLDEGASSDSERYRRRWYQLWLPSSRPRPPPTSLAEAEMTPLAGASFLSILTYAWLTPLMTLGWQRPLQAPDLWRVRAEDEAAPLSRALDEAWARRVERAKTGRDQSRWFGLDGGGNEPSLTMALNDAMGRQFWVGGLYKILGDVGQLMSPLLVKAIIKFAQERARGGTSAPHLGQGVGLAIGLPLLAVFSSVCMHQFFWRATTTGVSVRAALIASLYSRGFRFRPGQEQHDLLNHVSTDISRIDYCAQWFHATWTVPIQIAICLVLLCLQIGPAALAGVSLFVLLVPIQQLLLTYQLSIRRRSTKYTDARASLLRELLGSMRIVKLCAYEAQFEERLAGVREKELECVRGMVFIRATNHAVAYAIPTLAAVLSFITYATTHEGGLDPAVIFPSLGLFQLLRQPLMFLPRALSSVVDAKNALERLKVVFLAETIERPVQIDPDLESALVVSDAEFVWYSLPGDKAKNKKTKKGEPEKAKGDEGKAQGSKIHQGGGDAERNATRSIAFRLTDVSITIPRGSLVGIVGPVGCGKSSLLLGLLGEMPRTRGSVTFGGRVAYCSQMAWIQNTTLRENVVFGRPWDEERYWASIRDASLEVDLEGLPDGDLTEIGEKGINLSGGQKQRVNIARALYANTADIFLLDDPLSAVDAHVGHALFHNAILNNLKSRGKTVLLVTHALHFLPSVDRVYTLEKTIIVESEKPDKQGISEDRLTCPSLDEPSSEPELEPITERSRVAEQGTYEELACAGGAFAKFVEEFGNAEARRTEVEIEEFLGEKRSGAKSGSTGDLKERPSICATTDAKDPHRAAGIGRLEGKLIRAEKRETGSVEWDVYKKYITFGRGWIMAPVVLLSILLAQGCFAVNNYWLVWWQNSSFNLSAEVYMTGYAALGVGFSIFLVTIGVALGYLSYESSKHIYSEALNQVLHAPMSFFDTTPLGRILGVFGKDIDTIDNLVSDAIRLFIFTMTAAITNVVIITVLEYYFIAVAIVVLFLYQYFAAFYRASARELKRLDSNLRSLLYSHFSESLTGLVTIRAYDQVDYFLKDNKYYIDLENRALFLIATNQRWLAIRLDLLGSLLIFSVGMMSVVGVHGVSPAEIGLVLSTLSGLLQGFGMMTRQSAEVENVMNSVERLLHYTSSGDIPQEKPYVVAHKAPPKAWPQNGAIEFHDLVMNYRPGLPPVLRGVSLNVRGGEKIGVVGRTGAGKSSLMAALFRIVELSSGSILIDGLNIGEMGLSAVRSKIAIIPQEAGIFSGTIRSNMDPFNEYDDATLHDALRGSHLLGNEGKESSSTLGLDSPIAAEGASLSVGQRSLLSLARALVKQSKILVLDEATASVDLETDSKIQMTIQTEFADRTILCIAHRLRTIINYDRVVVMDHGQIVEIGSPAGLYAKADGIFRGMCDQSGIDGNEIARSAGAL